MRTCVICGIPGHGHCVQMNSELVASLWEWGAQTFPRLFSPGGQDPLPAPPRAALAHLSIVGEFPAQASGLQDLGRHAGAASGVSNSRAAAGRFASNACAEVFNLASGRRGEVPRVSPLAMAKPPPPVGVVLTQGLRDSGPGPPEGRRRGSGPGRRPLGARPGRRKEPRERRATCAPASRRD